jgi:hypothetical protein
MRGQVPVCVTIGGTGFSTALFPRDGRCLVPVTVAVQRTETTGQSAIAGWSCVLTPANEDVAGTDSTE